MKWIVYVPMAGDNQWFELCRCDGIDGLLAVIRALLETRADGPARVKIEVTHS